MRIKKVELTNWGPHKHLSMDFDAAVVGVVGANGKGKSNLLQALDYAFTGNLNKQKQEKHIRNFGQPDGATTATVEVEFEKGGKEGKITRTVTSTTSRRCLQWDGESWTKAADVEKQLECILGADKASLANAVFIKQGEMAAIVKGTPSERHTIFQKLMNLQFLEPRADDVQSKISSIRGSLQDYRPLLLELKTELTELESKIAEYPDTENDLEIVNKARKPLMEIKAADEDAKKYRESAKVKEVALEELRKSVKAIPLEFGFRTYDELSAEVATKLEELQAAEAALKGLAETAEKYNRKVSLQSSLDTMKSTKHLYQAKLMSEEDVAKANETLKKCSDALAYWSKAKELTAACDKATAANDAITCKAQEELRDKLNPITILINANKLDLDMFRDKLAELNLKLSAGTNYDECPICGRPMTEHYLLKPGQTEEEWRLEIEAEIKKTEHGIKEVEDTLDGWTKELQRLKTAAAVEKEFNKRTEDALATAEKALIAFYSTTPEIPMPVEEAIATQDELSKKLNDHRSVAPLLGGLDASIRTMQTELESMGSIEPPADSAVTVASRHRDAVKQKLNELKGAQKNMLTMNAKIESLKALVSSDLENCEAMQERISKLWEDHKYILAAGWMLVDPDETMDRNSVQSVSAVLGLLETLRMELISAMATLVELKAARTRMLDRIEAVKDRIARNEDKQRLIDDLTVVKQLLMRNGVPLAFMNDVFTKITGMVQEMLQRMGANFSVLPDPDRPCSFVFVRTDNDSQFEMMQEQLSGGQAIRLALALLLSCQQVILPEVGLLVLDEPSSHIDSEGVENMRDLFLSMQSILRNSDMQVVMVDHNEKLMVAFDKMITL